MTRRILILGGTTEARLLAGRLAARGDLDVTVSLAGRTAKIIDHDVPVRVGGFGGADGLAAWLAANDIDLLLDATHPFANQISRNAVTATAESGRRMLALRRPAWAPVAGDRWIEVADEPGAIAALGETPQRVFLALGRQEVGRFAAAPQHFYLVRSIDPVESSPLPDAVYVEQRGPFREEDEVRLMREHGIDILVARNSGGDAGYAKLAAARSLGVPAVIIRRPSVPETETVATVEAAVAWIDHAFPLASARGV
jgi:precorrin-6A/cobalt-precorrin-6A reductase